MKSILKKIFGALLRKFFGSGGGYYKPYKHYKQKRKKGLKGYLKKLLD